MRLGKRNLRLVLPFDLNFLMKNLNLKDTHRENALTNKTQGLTKSMNMDIWVLSALNKVFIRASYTEIKFSKK